MSLDKTANIIIVSLLMITLWGAYYLVSGIFNDNIRRQNFHTVQTQESLNKLEKAIEHLDTGTIKNPTHQITQDIIKTQQPLSTKETIPQHDEEKIALEKEIKLLYSRLEDAEKNQTKIVSMMEQRIKELQYDQKALRTQLTKKDKTSSDIRLDNNRLREELKISNDKILQQEGELAAAHEAGTKAMDTEIIRLKGQLSIQEKKLEKINKSYNDLKEQLIELAQIVTKKDNIITEKDKKISALKDQLNYISIKFSDLQKSFNESAGNQAILSQKLNKMKELNSTLQEYISQADSYASQENIKSNLKTIEEITTNATQPNDTNDTDPEKNRALELKKQVEVILTTDTK